MPDPRQLPIPGSANPCPLVGNHSRAFVLAFEAAAKRVLDPHSDNTKRAYRQAWQQWVRHCDSIHVPALPIQPTHLVAYLEMRARSDEPLPRLAPNSVRLHLAALSTLDQAARTTPADPKPEGIRGTQVVTRWLKSWARDNPRAPKKKAPAMSRNELERILVQAQERTGRGSRPAHVARYTRDRCILLFGVTGAFRAAELAELELGDVSRTDRGLQVRLRKSKTDQHGESALKGLMPQGQILRCPVDAWNQWVGIRGDWPGPAFVAVNRDGTLEREALSEDAVRRMVALRARAAGVDLSSHSMRASFATLARERGKSIETIMGQAGWSNPKTAMGYFRQVDLFVDNPSAGLLDD